MLPQSYQKHYIYTRAVLVYFVLYCWRKSLCCAWDYMKPACPCELLTVPVYVLSTTASLASTVGFCRVDFNMLSMLSFYLSICPYASLPYCHKSTTEVPQGLGKTVFTAFQAKLVHRTSMMYRFVCRTSRLVCAIRIGSEFTPEITQLCRAGRITYSLDRSKNLFYVCFSTVDFSHQAFILELKICS